MWNGYQTLDGIEVVNVSRTAAYARNAGLSWFKGSLDSEALPLMLGETYRTPLLDDAPWVDPDNPASLDFFGFYPIEVKGIEDSTRGAEVIEFITDGGVAGRLRHSTKPVVESGMLIATSEAGAEYGMQWLKAALLGGPCSNNGRAANSFGSTFCYLASEPFVQIDRSTPGTPAAVDGGDPDAGGDMLLDGGDPDAGGEYLIDGGDPDSDPEPVTEADELFSVPPVVPYDYDDCMVPLMRNLRKFSVVSGPTIDRKMAMRGGSQAWVVQFTGVAGIPWQFSAETVVLQGFLDPTVEDPIVDPSIDYAVDQEGFVYVDVDCEKPLWGPLYDPACPVLIAPPAPVDIALSCVTLPSNWRRRQVVIPDSVIPLWGDTVPVLSLRAGESDLRSIRVRFYSDPYETANPEADPCSYCGDMVITYIPYRGTMTIDGVTQSVYVDMPGGERRRADSLVVGTDGKPFVWPALTCGSQYVMTLDTPQNDLSPIVDLSLVARSH